MNRKELDELSAVIDGETDRDLMVQVSHLISRDEEVRRTLLRYRMMGDNLRGEEINLQAMELVMAVSKRLESEPTVLAPAETASHSRWLQPVAGAAIAASVAAAGVMLGPQFINPQQETDGGAMKSIQVVARPSGPVEPQAVVASRTEMQWKTVEERRQPRLIPYLERHSRYATQNGFQSVIPYTTLVSYGGAPSKQGE